MKNFLIKLFFVVFLFKISTFFGQYTEVINSNKPGFSESPYSVGTGVYQLESSFFLRKTAINPTFSRPESFGADFLLRTSFFNEKLEFNTQFSFQQDKIAFRNIFTSHYFNVGLGNFSVAAKYLLFQQKYKDPSKEVRSWKKKNRFDYNRLIPSVAVYVGVNNNFVANVNQIGGITPKIGILLQQNLTNSFNLISNFYYNNFVSELPELSYIVTATKNFSGRFSAFLENESTFSSVQYNHDAGAGIAYLFNKNLQVNTSARYFIEGKNTGVYGNLGISYRIDNHKDPYKDLNDINILNNETTISKYNKKQNSLFNRIFGFLKKKKTSARRRPTRDRAKTSKRKPNKRKENKESKKKSKKKEETELEKLEREIKELEEQLQEED